MKKKGPHGYHRINPMFQDLLQDGEAHWCPHCGQQASLKKHRANEKLVDFLRMLARYTMKHGAGWYTNKDMVPKTEHKHQKISTDAVGTARYMGLVDAADDATNGSGAPAGSYRITQLGTDFLMGICDVPDHVMVYNAEVVYQSSKRVDVHTANRTHFSYPRDVEGIVAPVYTGRGIPVKS